MFSIILKSKNQHDFASAQAAVRKYCTWTRWLIDNRHWFHFSQFWRLDVRSGGRPGQVWWGPRPGCGLPTWIPTWKECEPARWPLYKGTDAFMWLYLHDLITSQGPPLQILSHWGLDFNIGSWGERGIQALSITIFIAFIYRTLYEISCILMWKYEYIWIKGAAPSNTDSVVELYNILHMHRIIFLKYEKMINYQFWYTSGSSCFA